MIPIHSIKDIALVDDEILRAGLRKEFERLPDDYEYPTYGYFIVIESLEELQHPIPLEYGSLSRTPQPLSDYVEMIEEFDGYSQVVCILEADFGVSLFIQDNIVTHEELQKVLIYIH